MNKTPCNKRGPLWIEKMDRITFTTDLKRQVWTLWRSIRDKIEVVFDLNFKSLYFESGFTRSQEVFTFHKEYFFESTWI